MVGTIDEAVEKAKELGGGDAEDAPTVEDKPVDEKPAEGKVEQKADEKKPAQDNAAPDDDADDGKRT